MYLGLGLVAIALSAVLHSGCGSGGPSPMLPSLVPTGTGTVIGTVLAQGTETPVEGATVAVRDAGLSDTTDVNGRFEIRGVPAGQHTLEVSGTTAAGGTVNSKQMTFSLSSGSTLSIPPIEVAIEEPSGGGTDGGTGGGTDGGTGGGEEPPGPPF